MTALTYFVILQAKHKTTVLEQLSAAFERLTAAGFCTAFGAHRSGACAAPASNLQDPGDQQTGGNMQDSAAKARCLIPAEPVSKPLKSLVSVWQEYRYGTEAKPSIRQLLNDHGASWQRVEYNYYRKVWNKKKKIVSAVYAVKHIKSVSSTEALKILEDKRLVTPKISGQGFMGVCEFVEKFLPRLDDKVDVSGKCRPDLDSSWRSIHATDPHFGLWQTYLSSMRSKFELSTTLL